MRILTYIVSEADEGKAIRSVVPRCFHLGAHAFRRLKTLEAIRIDGEHVRADYRLSPGEVIEVHLPDDMPLDEVPCAAPAPTGPASFIRYRDEDLLIVSKGAPLATLPGAHIHSSTLREQLMAMLGANPSSFVYHPVNRLDKGTSGLLVIARHAHAQRLLSNQLHTGGFVREYLAVTEGIPTEAQGTIDAPIARAGEGARRCIDQDGKRAVTHYRVEKATKSHALLRLRLETGRTHQIRIHLASIGCPIAGDYLYGRELDALPGRFALHSAHLELTQPITGERISLDEPLPDALAALFE